MLLLLQWRSLRVTERCGKDWIVSTSASRASAGMFAAEMTARKCSQQEDSKERTARKCAQQGCSKEMFTVGWQQGNAHGSLTARKQQLDGKDMLAAG